MRLSRPGLRGQLLIGIACLIGVLVAAYSLLSVQFFIRGMDSIVATKLEYHAQAYLEADDPATVISTARRDGYFLAHDWNDLPEDLTRNVERPLTTNRMNKYHDSLPFTPPDVIYFVIHYERDGNQIWVGRKATRAQASTLVGQNIREMRGFLLWFSLGLVAVLALLLWLLHRQIMRPIQSLQQWTESLDAERLQQPPPDFSYPELNQMAKVIRNSLDSVQESLDREHRFLRHTSHELRTPLSTLRNNIELLHRLRQQEQSPRKPAEQGILERIDRASRTMKDLTETLLWLQRDDLEELPVNEVSVGEMVRQNVDDLTYLLHDKPVAITLATDDTRIYLPPTASSIVIGNLIRNAFQHTWEGEVEITQSGNELRIRNRGTTDTQKTTANNPESQGFGLGLKLVDQLVQKLGWAYRNQSMAEGHDVSLTIRQRSQSQTV